MPFKSSSQRRYCWYLYHKAIKEGHEPSWDCREWEKITPKNLPEHISNTDTNINKRKKKSSRSISRSSGKKKVKRHGKQSLSYRGKKTSFTRK